MSSRPPRSRPETPPPTPTGPPPSPPELIVVAHPEAGLRARGESVASVGGAEIAPLARVLRSAGVALEPLFGATEERAARAAEAVAESSGEALPDLSVYYRVRAPATARLGELAEGLREQETIETAFVKPGASPAQINDMAPAPEDAPPVTPDFSARQTYLNAAPAGIDARHAWTRPGGTGTNVRIIDIEGAWRFGHEDLVLKQGGVVGGTPTTDLGWRNHGTAVIGEFSGDRNAFGITGICPDAVVSAVSVFGIGSAAAIRAAADRLAAGDILLIELHRPGPRFNFTSPQGQRGFIAVEWWPDDFAAILYATRKGVIVVEAAGNGAENLGDALYDINPGNSFPSTWRNPFRRSPADSGAVLVGAGAPPPGTHGRDWGPDRSRLDFSNFGPCVDTQGWGREVTTCGYGDLQGGTNEDVWYTDQFSGTSSASPIVVGAVGCVQGALKAAGKPVLTPAGARDLLRTTGTPQQASAIAPLTQRIGNRPDLLAALNKVLPAGVQSVPLYRYWNAGIADHFYTTSWAELGTGKNGWAYEGIQCHVLPQPRPGTAPLHRYWNPAIGDHFYTTNYAELGAGRYGWAYEGVQCHVPVSYQTGTVPLYRYWNPGAGDHFYTTNYAELGGGRYGWALEGVQCYVYPTAVALPPEAAAAPPAEAGVGVPLEAAVPEPVAMAGMALPQSFRIGVAPAEPAEAEGAEEAFAVRAGAEAAGAASFTVPFPSGLRKKGNGGRNGRSRPVTVSFTVVGGDDDED